MIKILTEMRKIEERSRRQRKKELTEKINTWYEEEIKKLDNAESDSLEENSEGNIEFFRKKRDELKAEFEEKLSKVEQEGLGEYIEYMEDVKQEAVIKQELHIKQELDIMSEFLVKEEGDNKHEPQVKTEPHVREEGVGEYIEDMEDVKQEAVIKQELIMKKELDIRSEHLLKEEGDIKHEPQVKCYQKVTMSPIGRDSQGDSRAHRSEGLLKRIVTEKIEELHMLMESKLKRFKEMEKEIVDIKAKNSLEISIFSKALNTAKREKDEMEKRALQNERKVEKVEAENDKLAKAFDEKMISMKRQKESAEEELLYISNSHKELEDLVENFRKLEERNRELEERNRKLEKRNKELGSSMKKTLKDQHTESRKLLKEDAIIDSDSDDDTDRNEKGKRLAGKQLDSVRKIRKFSTVNPYLAGTILMTKQTL